MAFFSLNGDKKKDGGLDAFGQGIGLKYNGFGESLTELEQIFVDFSITNQWSASNLLVAGTNTTVFDYGLVHDLVNPAAGNQPTFSASDAGYNNQPILTFDGTTDYLKKAVANFGSGDSSGEIHTVINPDLTKVMYGFGVADEATNAARFSIQSTNKTTYLNLQDVGINNTVSDTLATDLSNQGVMLLSVISTGTDYRIFKNGVEMTPSGSFDGAWLGDMSGIADNITIGARDKSTNNYGTGTWAYTAYRSSVFGTDTERVNYMNELKTFYGI